MKKIFFLFARYFEPVCIVTLILLMTSIICIQIILRLFDASLSEAEEIARFLFVWAMYLSISYGIRENRHIRIRVVIDNLQSDLRLLAYNVSDLIFLIYSVVVVLFGWDVIRRSLELGQIAPATEVPIAFIYGSVVIGALFNVLHLLMRLHQRAIGIEVDSIFMEVR